MKSVRKIQVTFNLYNNIIEFSAEAINRPNYVLKYNIDHHKIYYKIV